MSVSALTAGRVTKEWEPNSVIRSYPMGGATQIWEGGIVCLDASGYAVPGATSTSLIAVGVAMESKLSGANDGDDQILVHEGVFSLPCDSAFDVTAVGSACYIVNDQEVSLTGTSRSLAGVVAGIDGSNAWVRIGLQPPNEDAQLTAFESSLASNANGAGASLVGIEDASSLFTATTVEGALEEAIGSNRLATLADGDLSPGIPVVFEIAVPDASSGHTDYVIVPKVEIVDVLVRKNTANGGSGDTVKIGTTANDISDAISLNINAKLLARAGSIDGAHSVIAAGGTLRVTWAKSTNVACQLTITAIKRA